MPMIEPVNPQPVEWWQTGIPGYVTTHPFPIGGGAMVVGHLLRNRIVFWAGAAYLAYGVWDLANKKGWLAPLAGFSR